MIKILHISDFHFSNEISVKDEQERVTDAIVDTINNKNIDFVFFTGDLVNKGNKLEHFKEAKRILISKISSTLNTDDTNILICCGNHDVNRNQELPELKSSFERMKDNNDLNEFVNINTNSNSFLESLKNLNTYIEFATEFYEEHKLKHSDTIHELYTIHKRTIGTKQIAIATINTACVSTPLFGQPKNRLFKDTSNADFVTM